MRVRRILVLLTAACAGLVAQEFRATLTGVVTDPSGAAIPNANVKTINSATNQVRAVKTNNQGLYTVPYLEPASYAVEISAQGFTTVRRESIVLSVSQDLNLSVQLQVGSTNTEVTVTGQQEIIETTDGDKGLVFDPLKASEYPLNGRQAYMLLSLTPGVIFTQEQFGANGFSGTRGWDVNASYKFNGARGGNGNNVFTINGAVISDNGSQWDLSPNAEAIQEFKAVTTAYDASYGHEAGGAVNFTIKSGGNRWRGNVFEYLRNSVFDANYFQSNAASQPRGRHEVSQFGGILGGPIRKDKDFLFLSFEGWQEAIPFPGAGTTTIPLDMRDGQHFGKYGMTVYDPLTTRLCGSSAAEPCSGSGGSTYWRDPFPNNVIPQNRISPVAQRILSYVPGPNTPGQGTGGLSNNFFNTNNEGRYWYNQPMARWDHVFGERDKFYALFSEQHGFEYRSSNGFGPPVVGNGNIDNNRTFTGLTLDETHVVTPSMVLDVRANYFRFVQLTPGYTEQAQSITPASVGMTGMIHAPTVSQSVIPNINIAGFASPLFGSGSFSWSPYNSWQFAPNLTWQKGRHGLRFGFEVHYEARGSVAPGNAYGTLQFGQALTQQASDRASTTNGGTDQYLGIASFLLGMPSPQGTTLPASAGGAIDNNASYYITRPYYGWYAQDDWRVTDHLTLNVGMRYEMQLAYLERYNRQAEQFNVSKVNPLSDQILAAWNADAAAYNAKNPKYPFPQAPAAMYGVWEFAGQDGLPRRTHYTDFTTFAPRFGFAYRIGQKTVIRGGAGVFFQSDTANQNSQTGFSVSTYYQSSFTNGQFPSACVNNLTAGNACAGGAPTGPYSIVQPFPQGLTQPAGPAAGALANIGQGATSNMLHFKTPRTYQYSLEVQRLLPSRIVFSAAFAGNYALYDRDSHNEGFPNDAAGIALQNQAISDPTFFSVSVPNPFFGILPSTTGLGGSSTVSASTLINNYPLWGGYTDGDYTDRYFRSDALQVRVQKTLSKSPIGAMTYVLSYTFSKEYAQTCCLGTNWTFNTGAYLQLSPNGVNGTLVPHQQNPVSNSRFDFDSANKPQEIAFSGVWDLPLGKGQSLLSGATGTVDKLASGWRIAYTASYISGSPVGLPQSINFCGQYSNYVDPNTGSLLPQSNAHWFNNNAKCYANFPANSTSFTGLPQRFSGNVENPASPQFNIAIEKITTFKERYSAQLRAEAFNIANSPILGGPQSTTFTSAVFGIIPNSQNNFPRIVQVSLKLMF
jgi:hypothetical protein